MAAHRKGPLGMALPSHAPVEVCQPRVDPALIVGVLTHGPTVQARTQGWSGQRVLLGGVVVMVRVSVHIGHLQTQILMSPWNPPGQHVWADSMRHQTVGEVVMKQKGTVAPASRLASPAHKL